MYDTQQSTGLPDRPALLNWWILMCHHVKMCHERRKWNHQYTERWRGNGAKMTHQYIRDALKWGGEKKDVSKNVCVLPEPCTCTEKTSSTEGLTSSSRAVFLLHAKERNLKSLPVSHLSIFFPLHLKAAHWREKGFSYFCLRRHVRDLGVSALFSGARHFLPQMKTKIHPPGWIINDTQA